MYKCILSVLFILNTISLVAQTEVSGKVIDKKGNPILGVNVYLDGTYDGSTTDDQGNFNFITEEKGEQTLIVSFMSFQTKNITKTVSEFKNIQVILKEDINTLNSVVLSGSTFSAGDNSKATALKPLDIVTTAGAAGDIIGAFQTLPGTSTVGEDGRLFVRGGEANESNVYVDDFKVFQPFLATGNAAPTRGRYSPFLFDGISFSTGGYSAEYGDALSSVLLLNTKGIADKEQADFSFLNLGFGASGTKKWKNSSLVGNAQYINLRPYIEVISQNIEWKRPYESLSGEAIYKKQFNKGFLKIYGGYSYSDLAFVQEDINIPTGLNTALTNRNAYGNISYKRNLKNQWVFTAGSSISHDQENNTIDQLKIEDRQSNAHLKVKLNKRFSNYFKLKLGAEQFLENFEETVVTDDLGTNDFEVNFNNNQSTAFVESELFFSKNLAVKAGLRAARSNLLNETNISPRASLAYKTGKRSQISLSYGDFYQTPISDVIKFDSNLNQQKATHYIANYMYQHNGRTFRLDGYHKEYDQLIKYDTDIPIFTSNFNNSGFGQASGIDVFWRDNKSIKNLEYWLSYSYLDTKRDFANFSEEATPNFAAKHNTSIVTKYWIEKWRSQIGLTYSYASGRSFDNPNTVAFQNEKTKAFQDLSFSWAYLMSPQKILFLSISNVPNFRNEFGFQYANTPNSNGIFERRAITPTANRFIVLGFFWTISSDKNENQLKNL